VIKLKKVSETIDIWEPIKVIQEDIDEAINYATISLPWTFDRMGYGPRTQKAVNARLMHILMGVLNQTILERILTKKGYKCKKDWTNYRESDIFDFIISDKKYDVKTIHIYSKYNDSAQREKFSKELLIENKNYPGPEWRHFFPLMIPLTQLSISKLKDSYIFGIAETNEDLRKREPQKNDNGFWCAVPFKFAYIFFHSTIVIKQREKVRNGFQLNVKWISKQNHLFPDNVKNLVLTIFGEWDGKKQTENIIIKRNEFSKSKKTYSSLSCIKLEHPAYLYDDDDLVITVDNHYNEFIAKTTNPLINLNSSDFEWHLNEISFVNLQVPDDYVIYWLGYIPYQEFAESFQKYNAYFIPHPKDYDRNTIGIITPKLRSKLAGIDRRRLKAIDEGIDIPWPEFLSLINKRNEIEVGMMVVAMRGPQPLGGACYFYPPYAILESAIYVLTSDLFIMDSLPKK